jgi:uncharacterized damage-inducible protein DinB
MAIHSELISLFTRDLRRVAQEIEAFPTDESLWQTAPGVTNSAGNLALHLEGNLREYIGRQLGGIAYTRQRPLEFSTIGLTRAEVAARIDAVRESVIPALATVDLDTIFPENVLGQPLTARQFVLHLLGHLNYHLGQIDYLRRMNTGDGAIKLAGL